MKNTIEALVSIGFKQEEAEKQVKELNDVIMALIVKRVADENPGIELTKENYEATVKEKYTTEEYQMLLMDVSGDAVKGYFDVVTKNLTPIKKQEFFETVKKDFVQGN